MSKRNVVHIEIPVSDTQSAAKFYEGVFGWKMEHNAEFDYTMWSDGANSGGGFVHLHDENADGKILVYIASDDIDADLEKVVSLGGTVVKPKTEIPGTGWFGVFQDPSGNRVAIYTSMNQS
jgi:hypothetical protein